MKIKVGDIDAVVRRPDSKAVIYLCYGPDSGRVRIVSRQIIRSACNGTVDPFQLVTLESQLLGQRPARLLEEATSTPLTGGRRIVRVRGCGDEVVSACRNALQGLQSFAADCGVLIMLESGDLSPRSTLRQAVERATSIAYTLPCYRDEADTIERLIRQRLQAAGIELERAACDALLAVLGNDRQETLNSINRLILYLGHDSERLTLEDVESCLFVESVSSSDQVIDAVMSRDVSSLERAFRNGSGQIQPIAILRGMAEHIMRLISVRENHDSGMNIRSAMQALRPPIFFRRSEIFRKQAESWTADQLWEALLVAWHWEQHIKLAQDDAQALCFRACRAVYATR